MPEPQSEFAPYVQLEASEQANLVQLSYHPGFEVLTKLMRAEVDKFAMAMINTDAARPEAVLARHHTAKAATQFFAGIVNRINQERMDANGSRENNLILDDVTEGILDIGSRASREADFDLDEYSLQEEE